MAKKVKGQKKKCIHPDFWFDRTLSYCSVHEDMEMMTVCTECGKSSCEIGDKE